MNETIKERTTKNGYVKGIYIGEGGRFDYGLGGGVSIITSATWTAAFYAGLERIEQRAHSVHIARYTPGLEATVSWPKLDLKFRNNTKNNILIKAKARVEKNWKLSDEIRDQLADQGIAIKDSEKGQVITKI